MRHEAGQLRSGLLEPGEIAASVAKLAADPASGQWDARYGILRDLPRSDTGQHLIVSVRVR